MLSGRMLVLGGGRVVADAVVQRIPTSGLSALIGRLPAPRADMAAVVDGSTVIVVGGGAGTAFQRGVIATTDGVTFRTIATLPVAVRYAAVAELGGRIYVFGGAGAAGDVATIQVVDVAAGTAHVLGRLPSTLSHATALVVGGRMLIAGGRHAGAALSTILEFDPATGRTTTAGRLPRAMSDAAGAVVGSTGYLLGGEARAPLDSIVVLTPG
jgi:hypothetical protein